MRTDKMRTSVSGTLYRRGRADRSCEV